VVITSIEQEYESIESWHNYKMKIEVIYILWYTWILTIYFYFYFCLSIFLNLIFLFLFLFCFIFLDDEETCNYSHMMWCSKTKYKELEQMTLEAYSSCGNSIVDSWITCEL